MSSGKRPKVRGRVQFLYQLDEFQEQSEETVLFVENSDGSEEIPSRNIRAIVLSHDLP